jgi:SpoIVB peptidase S55
VITANEIYPTCPTGPDLAIGPTCPPRPNSLANAQRSSYIWRISPRLYKQLQMKTPTLTAAIAAFSILLSTPSAQTTFMPVEEIRAGMQGVGETVFQGTRLEQFKVHILGVLRDVIGPRRTLILARLEGGPLAKTGVVAGMSGSPVYIDGRLIGAVSYALGQFATEPIAGVTPIAEMTDAASLAPAASASVTRPVDLVWPPTPRALTEIWSRDLGRLRPFVDDPSQASLIGTADVAVSARLGSLLKPIAVPLVTAGFASDVLAPLTDALTTRGFVPVSAAAAAQSATPTTTAAKLRPGDAMGVALMTGDFMLGATGTVTYVDGDKVYGFGHPLYNIGPTQFPLTQAEVQVVLPSLLQSIKIASFGDVIGTLQQDRATAVAGRLGQGPTMIPVALTLNSNRAGRRTFSFNVVKDVTFTPLLTYLAVANVLTSYERNVGPSSFTVRGTATIRDYGDIAFEDIFTGDQPAGGAAAYVAGPLTFLLKNALEPVNVEKVSLTIDASEQTQTARIERVWLDTDRPRAGRDAMVKVQLRTFKGEELVKSLLIQIPANTTGSLQLLVSDASRLAAEDRRDMRGAESQRVSQLIRTFNKARRGNRLYVRLSTTDQGAIVNGEPLSSLPPSVLAVLESDRNSGTFSPLRNATRGEWELPVEFAVQGSRLLTISLDQ